MTFGTLRLAGTALIAAALLAPAAASAQAYGAPHQFVAYRDGPARDRDGYPRRGPDRDGYYENRTPPPRRDSDRDRREQRCDHGSVGTILGAIAGGLLGNAVVGRHGNRTAGTLAGAGAGALAGNAADRDCD